MYQDKTLTCVDCGADFVFSAGEQDFFASRGFSDPTRCPSCRKIRKAQKATYNASLPSGSGYHEGRRSGGYDNRSSRRGDRGPRRSGGRRDRRY